MSAPKAAFRISALAAKPIDVELIHPVEGPTGIHLKLVGPHSGQLKAAMKAYFAKDEKERTDKDEFSLFTACVVGWDEEAFEMPFTPENALNFFSQPENTWVTEQVVPKLKDSTAFFRKES